MNSMLLAIALGLATAAHTPTPRCFVPGPPAEELRKAIAVFSGKVVGRDYVTEENSSGEISQRLVIKLAVERVWKGEVYTEVKMYTSEMHLPNGYIRMFAEDFKFDDDKEYLVYAFGESNKLTTSECTRTRELANADDDLKELGDGHALGPSFARVERRYAPAETTVLFGK